MNFYQSLKSMNFWAILVAGIIFIPFGWLWNNVLFEDPWLSALGKTGKSGSAIVV